MLRLRNKIGLQLVKFYSFFLMVKQENYFCIFLEKVITWIEEYTFAFNLLYSKYVIRNACKIFVYTRLSIPLMSFLCLINIIDSKYHSDWKEFLFHYCIKKYSLHIVYNFIGIIDFIIVDNKFIYNVSKSMSINVKIKRPIWRVKFLMLVYLYSY